MKKLIDGEFTPCDKADLTEGDVYRLPFGDSGWAQHAHSVAPKEDTERQWQESELLRTDNWPDDRPPGSAVMLNYRQELRDYNNQADFPNGTRPTI